MAVGLGVGVVLARALGADGRGSYVFATFAGQLLLSLANFGLESACSVVVARDRSQLGAVHTLCAAACAAIGGAVLLPAVLAQEWICARALPGLHPTDLMMLAAALPFWVYQNAAYGMLIGLGENKRRAAWDLGFNLVQNLSILPILALLWMGWAEQSVVRLLVGAYYGFMIAYAAALAGMLARRGRLWAAPGRELVREFFGLGFWVFAGNIGASIMQRIDKYAIKSAGATDAAFGVYTLATGLAERTRIVPQAISRSSYARLASAELEPAAHLAAACFRQVLAMGTLLCLAGAALSPLLPIVYGAEFAPAIVPFLLFLAGRAFHNASWMLSNFFTAHLRRPKVPMALNWILIVPQVAGCWWAMQLGSLPLAAAVVSATYFANWAATAVLFLRAQPFVGARELLMPARADFEPWRRMVRRG